MQSGYFSLSFFFIFLSFSWFLLLSLLKYQEFNIRHKHFVTCNFHAKNANRLIFKRSLINFNYSPNSLLTIIAHCVSSDDLISLLYNKQCLLNNNGRNIEQNHGPTIISTPEEQKTLKANMNHTFVKSAGMLRKSSLFLSIKCGIVSVGCT